MRQIGQRFHQHLRGADSPDHPRPNQFMYMRPERQTLLTLRLQVSQQPSRHARLGAQCPQSSCRWACVFLASACQQCTCSQYVCAKPSKLSGSQSLSPSVINAMWHAGHVLAR